MGSRPLTAYSRKEQFFKALDSKDSDSARIAFSRWRMAAQNSGLAKFIDFGNTMVRWSVSILNPLDCPQTNSFTEGAGNKVKVLKRNACGYRNFFHFRNRILHRHRFNSSTQKGAA